MDNMDRSRERFDGSMASGHPLLEHPAPEGDAQGCGAYARGEMLRLDNRATLSAVLASHARLRRDLACLRKEHVLALRESRAAGMRKDARIAALQSEVALLRAQLAVANPRRLPAPAGEFLRQPLAVRGAAGSFLGVRDRSGAALTLCDILALVDQVDPARTVGTSWFASEEGWVLALGLSWPSGRSCSYSLLLKPLRTPSGNTVTQLVGMTADGRTVPREYLRRMIRTLLDASEE